MGVISKLMESVGGHMGYI